MSSAMLQIGSEIAQDVRTSIGQDVQLRIKTTGDVLAIVGQEPGRSTAMLRTTCGLLGLYLDLPGNDIPIDTLDARRKGFREFLVQRTYAENSVRSYVFQLRVLLKTARRHGWKPNANAPERWKPLLALASEKKITDIVRHFSQVTKTPADVTVENVDLWCKETSESGMLFTTVAAKRNAFWRLLRDTGWTAYNPPYLIKQTKYGIPSKQLAPELRSEIEAVLQWKQAEFAKGRPKWGKVRAVTANGLRLAISQLAGFAISVCNNQPLSLLDLVEKDLIEGFIEWAMSQRGRKGAGIQSKLAMLAAVMLHHPAYASHDFRWLSSLIDSIPIEDVSERRQRKSSKLVAYEVLEAVPDKIRVATQAYARRKKKNAKRIARMAMEELMFRWLLVLPWRQRNLRECRVGGLSPNLFKGKIPAHSGLDRPAWVVEEESRNSNAEFWQITFSRKETKTDMAIQVLLPHQLIGPLEEYLELYRPALLDGKKTETLFLNQIGKPMRADLVEKAIGNWSLKFAGVRTTPHLFRDAVAFAWLKAHPEGYLRLSKMLWHRNIKTTISVYGAGFNESSGVSAMEEWLVQRNEGSEAK